jgi:hypothetical protein
VSLRNRIDRLADAFNVKRIVPNAVLCDDDGIIVKTLPTGSFPEWIGRHVSELPDSPSQWCKAYHQSIDPDVICGLAPALFPTNQTEER